MTLRPEARFSWLEPRLVAVVVISSAAVLSTSIVVGGWKATHATEQQAPKTLDVAGEASRHLIADEMTWTLTVHGRDADRDTALANLRTNITTARTYLTGHGLTDSELGFGETASQRDDDTVTNKDSDGNETSEQVPGDWDATMTITVTTKNIGHGLAAHNDEASTEELTDTDIGDATCTSSKADAVQPQVLGEARANVRAQAKLAIDQYGGASLGRLMAAQIGDANIGSDCTDIIVSATANATYEIE